MVMVGYKSFKFRTPFGNDEVNEATHCNFVTVHCFVLNETVSTPSLLSAVSNQSG